MRGVGIWGDFEMNIAFIAKPTNPLTLTHLSGNRFVTEAWAVSANAEPKLKNGRISLHIKQNEKSYIAGNILATYEIKAGEKSTGHRRIGIVFRAGGRQVSGKLLTWKQEQARY